MRLKVLAVAIIGAAITAPACALAATTITETENIASSPVPYTDTFTLPSFNTSLGTLQSVEYVLSDQTTVTVLVNNGNGVTENFTDASASFPLSVTGPGELSVADTVTQTVASGSVAANSQGSYPGPLVTDTQTATFTTGLSSFESGVPLNLFFSADAGSGSYSGNAEGNVLFGGSAVTGGTFQVLYTYASAVPEPATWAFLMLGIGGIGAATRSRRKAGLALAAAA